MDLLHTQAKAFLRAPAEPARPFGLGLTPFQLIKERTPVPAGAAPRFSLRDDRVQGTTDSWREWAEGRVVEGFREATGAVFESRYEDRCVPLSPTPSADAPESTLTQSPPCPPVATSPSGRRGRSSSPTATTATLAASASSWARCCLTRATATTCVPASRRAGRPAPSLTDLSFPLPPFCHRLQSVPPTPSQLATPSTANSRTYADAVAVPQLVLEALQTCDVDVRASLLQNVVIVGGGSQLPGFTDRLNYELSVLFPGVRPPLPLPVCRPSSPVADRGPPLRALPVSLSSKKSGSTPRATRPSASTARGWAGRSSPRSGRSTSCGSPRRSGTSTAQTSSLRSASERAVPHALALAVWRPEEEGREGRRDIFVSCLSLRWEEWFPAAVGRARARKVGRHGSRRGELKPVSVRWERDGRRGKRA